MAMSNAASLPLKGIRVCDLSRLLPGPALSWALQGQGAQIDRIEPKKGDFARHVGPFVEERGERFGSYFACVNRGKRSLALDFGSQEGLALLKKLAFSTRYNVVVEGFKPGTLENMGIDPVELLEACPRKILVRISGYGQTGPMAKLPGHDVNYLAMAGGLREPRNDDSIELPKLQIADMSGALVGALGVVSRLLQVERSREHVPVNDRIVDVSLTESALSLAAPTVLLESLDEKTAGLLSGRHPLYSLYKGKDERWVAVGAVEQKFQETVQTKIGLKGGKKLRRSEVKDALGKLEANEAAQLLADSCVTPVLKAHDLPADPQHSSRGTVASVNGNVYVRPPIGQDSLWKDGLLPLLGEHSREILIEAGVTTDEAEAALKGGTITVSSA